MKSLNQLFSRTPGSKDIRIQLKEVEREQMKRRRDLENLELSKQEKVKQAVAAKSAGKQEIVREIFREMRQLEIDHGFISTDLRRISLSKTALSAFLRKSEMLEKNRDHRSTQNLITRFKNSNLQKAIDTADVDDDTFNDILNEILGEEESGVTGKKAREDAGFAEFDRAITEMAKAEDGEPLSQKARNLNVKDLDDDARKYADDAAAKIDEPRYPSLPDLPMPKTTRQAPMASVFDGEGASAVDNCSEFCVGGTATTEKVRG